MNSRATSAEHKGCVLNAGVDPALGFANRQGTPETDPSVPIIAGHSHCSCLGVPLGTRDGLSRLVMLENGDGRFCGFSGSWPRIPSFWEDLAEAARGRTVILVWQGNQHMAEFILAPGQAFDFVLFEDQDLALDPHAEVVPDLAIQERFAESIVGLDEVIPRLYQHGAVRVIVSGTPAPRGSMEVVRKGVLAEKFFAGVAEHLGLRLEDIPISTPLFMHKLWRVVQRLTREAAVRQAAEFLPVPDITLQDGFLRPEFGGVADITHANAAYGQVTLDHFQSYLTRKSP